MLRRSLAVALVALCAAAPAAHAKKDGPHEEHHGGDDAAVHVDVDVHVAFSTDQRVMYREYWDHRYGKKCPPGLAKKHDGCMPPGLAKRRYHVGHRLPEGVVIAPVPEDLRIRIGVPPVGYVYGIVDGDLVKLAAGTLLVVDALQGLAR